jgi:hypothetical protein
MMSDWSDAYRETQCAPSENQSEKQDVARPACSFRLFNRHPDAASRAVKKRHQALESDQLDHHRLSIVAGGKG